jgi:hypothetical protein
MEQVYIVDSFFPPPFISDDPCPDDGHEKREDKDCTPDIPSTHVSRDIHLWHRYTSFSIGLMKFGYYIFTSFSIFFGSRKKIKPGDAITNARL